MVILSVATLTSQEEFRVMDVNHDGFIDKIEIGEFKRRVNTQATADALGVSAEAIQRAVNIVNEMMCAVRIDLALWVECKGTVVSFAVLRCCTTENLSDL